MSEDKAVRRSRSRYKTIVCSFCMTPGDDACFSWASGVCICRRCLEFATEEVAVAKKTTAVADDLTKIASKLTMTKEDRHTEASAREETIAQIQAILNGPPVPDDIA